MEIESKVGVDYAKVPPVPIPNTEVKLGRAEDTWWVTAWENRYSPTFAEKTFRLERLFIFFDPKSVLITPRPHLFPFRTQKLSLVVPKILGG